MILLEREMASWMLTKIQMGIKASEYVLRRDKSVKRGMIRLTIPTSVLPGCVRMSGLYFFEHCEAKQVKFERHPGEDKYKNN